MEWEDSPELEAEKAINKNKGIVTNFYGTVAF